MRIARRYFAENGADSIALSLRSTHCSRQTIKSRLCFMDPFGFAHLRYRRNVASTQRPLLFPAGRRKADAVVGGVSNSNRLPKARLEAFSRIYYPVNTPVCSYQKQLLIDSLRNNLLVALPKELDTFFVAAVLTANFRRWYPDKKAVFVAASADSAKQLSRHFLELTGFFKGEICVYGTKKKSERLKEWNSHNVIFATAENLLSDFRKEAIGADVGLVVVEDAHRATLGSHPVAEFVRCLIFIKAQFRLLGLTDVCIDRAQILQLLVMNLQIGCVRSMSNFQADIALAISSPRMADVPVPITSEMDSLAKALTECMSPLVSLLHECGVLPSSELRKIANFSFTSLKEAMEREASHLTDVFLDLRDLLCVYDTLMCEGLTAFAYDLQEKSSRSPTIQKIIETNVQLKSAFFLPDISRNGKICSHKMDKCLEILSDVLLAYPGEKSITIILCRDRNFSVTQGLVQAMQEKLGNDKINVIVYSKNSSRGQYLSERSFLDRKCNIVIVPCGSEQICLGIGYIDRLICFDEGLSSLHYTGGISVGLEGQMFSLRTVGYETNICRFLSADSAVNCIEARLIKAANLCTDNAQLFPTETPFHIVEYWATEADEESGVLSALEQVDFEERLKKDAVKGTVMDKVKNISELLELNTEEALLWLDMPQRTNDVGHSTATFTLANVISNSEAVLYEQHQRFLEKIKTEKQTEEEEAVDPFDMEIEIGNTGTNFAAKEQDRSAVISHAEKDKDNGKYTVPRAKQKRPRASRIPKTSAPPLKYIESASFRLFAKREKHELCAEDFENPVEKSEEFRLRRQAILKILENLRKCRQL